MTQELLFTETSSIRLIDAVERNKHNPTTFHIPNEAIRKSVKVGDYVRIGLEDVVEGGGERFWTCIVELNSENHDYVGTVENELVVFDIPLHSLIAFDQHNVLEVLHPS